MLGEMKRNKLKPMLLFIHGWERHRYLNFRFSKSIDQTSDLHEIEWLNQIMWISFPYIDAMQIDGRDKIWREMNNLSETVCVCVCVRIEKRKQNEIHE